MGSRRHPCAAAAATGQNRPARRGRRPRSSRRAGGLDGAPRGRSRLQRHDRSPRRGARGAARVRRERLAPAPHAADGPAASPGVGVAEGGTGARCRVGRRRAGGRAPRGAAHGAPDACTGRGSADGARDCLADGCSRARRRAVGRARGPERPRSRRRLPRPGVCEGVRRRHRHHARQPDRERAQVLPWRRRGHHRVRRRGIGGVHRHPRRGTGPQSRRGRARVRAIRTR